MSRTLYALTIAIFLGACGSASSEDRTAQAPSVRAAGQDVTIVDGVRLQIVNTERCTIRYVRGGTESDLQLGMPSPCSLHRAADGTVRTRTVKGERVLLVERSTPDPRHAGDCDTQVQAVLVSSERVRLSSAVERVAICAPFRWDDVMFIGLAESTDGK